MAPYDPINKGKKDCPRCTRWLPLMAYGRNRSTRDGLTVYCIDCKRQQEHEWKMAHLEQRRAHHRNSMRRRTALRRGIGMEDV